MSDLFATPAPTVDQVLENLISILSRRRYRFTDENDLQRGIEQVLTEAKIDFQREARLNASDRLDFLLPGGVAIEVKIKGSIAELLRQASRYLARPEIQAVLVVGSPHWITRVPETLNDKPLRALRLVGSLL